MVIVSYVWFITHTDYESLILVVSSYIGLMLLVPGFGYQCDHGREKTTLIGLVQVIALSRAKRTAGRPLIRIYIPMQ